MAKKYFEVIDVRENAAVDFLILNEWDSFEDVKKTVESSGQYKLRRITKSSGDFEEKIGYWYNVHRTESIPSECIGNVWVDSGMMVVGDPCLVSRAIGDNVEEIYKATDNKLRSSVIGPVTAFQTAFGDGVYDVLAKRDEHGRIVKIEILMG